MQISISDIRLDGNTQARAGMKTETISDYAEAMKQGDRFPPVVVFNDGNNYWLADGFHRIYAARDIGVEEVDAEVLEGSIHDARWFAVGANNRHGARPTNEDKRSAVQLALDDEKLCARSNREIARQCGVSEFLVRKLRDEIPDSAIKSHLTIQSIPQSTPTQNLEKHGFSQGEDFEVFHEILKNPQGGYSLGLRSKKRQGGVLAADQRKTPQNAAEQRRGSGPGHEAQGVLEPQAVVLL
mgnify:CR=1 FL=1